MDAIKVHDLFDLTHTRAADMLGGCEYPWEALKKIKETVLAIGAALIGFLLQGMFDNCFYNYRVFMMFWTMLALGVAACHIAKNRSEAEQNQ